MKGVWAVRVNHYAIVNLLRRARKIYYGVVFVVWRGPWGRALGIKKNRSRCSGLIRSGQSTVGGPKWTSLGQNGPKWTILVHFGLANALKNPVRNKVILTLLDVSDIFYFCSARGGGRGSPRCQGCGGGGVVVLVKIPGGGKVSRGGAEGPGGREGGIGEFFFGGGGG